ncbi:pikachurin-like [Pectinophora gossypiella]|uniref:pikachurin-like n=1 Tax=Pectinophora gossypiella TaxID=13191 RepID=UPI00214F39F4|nr:pikachurin-like [Pectinophora gossypiella]
MAWRSAMAAPRVVPLVILAAALVTATAPAPTQDPVQFEAAFQGRCGEGSPCEQLCRELHDGTYECGCGPGYILHVNGYGCLELNATKASDTTDDEEDVLYQKDVSFSAELEVAPSSRISDTIRETRLTTTLPKVDKKLNPLRTTKPSYTYTGERSKEADGLKSLLEDGVSKIDLNIIADEKKEGFEDGELKVTTLGPSLEQKVPGATVSPPWTAAVDNCDCTSCDGARCSCPLSTSKCKTDSKISTPRFSGSSWLALHALRGAYKRVRLRLRVRPERARGVLLLTGEHDDLSGDYLALLLRNGHVELRFDCGSGAGVLRSPEPVRLGHWNTISVYRHRWDAWLRLNNGKRVRGRSKGLFSRMTFREPVWVGGAGNTTGLQTKLGLSDGLLGCVDFLRINGDTYRLIKDAVATLDIGECAPTLAPWRPTNEVTTSEAVPVHPNDINTHAIYDINDIVHFEDNDLVMRDAKKHDHNMLDNSVEQFKVFTDINKIQLNSNSKSTGVNIDVENDLKSDDPKTMQTDLDGKCECQHGGGCVGKLCLCPLGYAGEKCEITLDLKVPRFNGSSYLRLPGLGTAAQAWLDIQITLKPTSGDGLVLYNAEHASGDGDFFSLHLRDYYVEFAFDLGSGIALVRSAYTLEPNTWHRISVSRSGRRASLRVRSMSIHDATDATRSVVYRGPARHLTLKQPMLLGGAPHPLPPRLALRRSFSGCVGQLVINDEELAVVSTALGGVNVDNCEEPRNNSCSDRNLCKETLEPIPIYPHNISVNDIHHSIVAKKGFRSKPHKSKQKKHSQHIHMEKYKKKFYAIKKHQYMSDMARSNDIVTEGPGYDGQTYMQVKYLNENEINWGDTNTYPSFIGKDSFIHIDDEETMKRLLSYTLDINIRFRSVSPNGLLVWSGRAPLATPGDFLSLAVENSVLVFRYDLGSGEVVIIANHTKVDDGLWHRARATRNRQAGVLEVDGLGSVGKISPGKLKQLNTENGLYIGGLPSIEVNTSGKYKSGLVGCVSQISLSGDFDIPLSLSKLPHTITNNVGRCTP